MITQDERNFRLTICQYSGWSINELPLIWRFINGDDSALNEIPAFRKWNEEQNLIVGVQQV